MPDSLDRAVVCAGQDPKPCPQPPDCLMVRAVDRETRPVQLTKKAGCGINRVEAVSAVDLAMACDLLAQRAAEIDIEDLQPAANADDRLPRAQKCIDERELALIARFVKICRTVDRLTVKARVYITPAGQQQNVRALRRFGKRRTDQSERVLVIFQAYR